MQPTRGRRAGDARPSVEGKLYFKFVDSLLIPTIDEETGDVTAVSAEVSVYKASSLGDPTSAWTDAGWSETVYPTLSSKLVASTDDYGVAEYSTVLGRWEVVEVLRVEDTTDDGEELKQVIWGYLKSDLLYMGSSSIDEYQPVFSGGVLSTWEDASKVTSVHDSMLASGYKLETGVWVSADLRDGKYFVRAARTCSVEV